VFVAYLPVFAVYTRDGVLASKPSLDDPTDLLDIILGKTIVAHEYVAADVSYLGHIDVASADGAPRHEYIFWAVFKDMSFRPYSLEEGAFLVRLARRAVEEYLTRGVIIEPPADTPERLLKDPYGVFTTVEKLAGGKLELRGCIGYPEGYRNVAYATIYSAIAACCQDPRFPAMTSDELDDVVFEVSVLSPLRQLPPNPKEYLKSVEVGRHGIVIKRGFYSGLLLPQVPVEECWDSEEFLSNGCLKAWLHADCWLDERTKVYVFEAQLFKEKAPRGEIYERDLKQELADCRARTNR
jgi:uncharacterized protein (TIGR00296 family)